MGTSSQYDEIEWRNGLPYSLLCHEYYFSSQIAIKEACYTYLKHGQLLEKITLLTDNSQLTIAETGFAAALNFLTTVIAWRKANKAANVKLNYISIECYPLKPDDLNQILQLFPELAIVAAELLSRYYLLTQGFHRIHLADNICLTLIVNEIESTLTQLNSTIDIWYLNKFNTTKNTSRWNNQTIKQTSRLSKYKTTFIAATANSELPILLEQYGFKVKKTAELSNTNELFYGYLTNVSTTQIKSTRTYLNKQLSNIKQPGKIAIIGGGISGATTAYSLAKRGYLVTIFERNSQLAQEASGNNQGVIYGNFSINDANLFELSSNAYRLTNHLINSIDVNNQYHNQCGVIQVSHNNKQLKRNLELIKSINDKQFVYEVNKSQMRTLSNCEIKAEHGIFFPHGMWINPAKFINDLVKQYPDNIQILTLQNITKLEYLKDKWQITNEQNQLSNNFAAIIICNSFMINQFEQIKTLPIRKIRGQVSIAQGQSPTNCIICAEGYITPSFANNFSFGATFDFKNQNFAVTQEEHLQNTATITKMLDIPAATIDSNKLTGKTNIRVSSNDYLPIIGPISDKLDFTTTYAKLRLDKNYYFKDNPAYLPNLYINTGYGSKGLLFAPLGAEIIADYIDNSPLPISEQLRQAIHPNRLYARELIKNGS